MALCLASSLVETGRFDPVDQLERYLRWYRSGYLSSTGSCFDIGTTTEASLLEFEQTRQPYRPPLPGVKASNGSIMRLAPVPMAFANAPEMALQHSGDSSRTTHSAPAAVDACRYLGGLLVGLLQGLSKAEVLSNRFSPVPGYWNLTPLSPEIEAVARGSFKVRQPPGVRGESLAGGCLEAALWAFYRSEDFAGGCLMAANLGDDSDTTAAVYGQLAGACYGETGLPEAWRAAVAHPDLILSLAEQLFQLSETITH
jgi:ADP-ribosylglycohydrolase